MEDWTTNFNWDSIDQEKSYHAFLKWAREKRLPSQVKAMDLFLIQKSHESALYWNEVMSRQIEMLQDQIKILQEQLASQSYAVRQLTEKKSKIELDKAGHEWP